MRTYNPDHLAHIAATLLSGQIAAEPHHVRQAVATARLLLDEARGPDEDVAEGADSESAPPATEAKTDGATPAAE